MTGPSPIDDKRLRFDNFGDKKYSYSLYLANKKVEKDWERAVMDKTKKYFRF